MRGDAAERASPAVWLSFFAQRVNCHRWRSDDPDGTEPNILSYSVASLYALRALCEK